ncbi:unnamed protein product, partial [Nesidiocoris tenuis]
MNLELYKSKGKLFRIASTALHGVAAGHFWFAAVYDYTYVNIPISVSPIFSSYGRQLKFLTYWDVPLQRYMLSSVSIFEGPRYRRQFAVSSELLTLA